MLDTPELQYLRDKLGSHVNETQVKAALEKLDRSVEGRMQIAPRHMDTHFFFAANLVCAMLPENILEGLLSPPDLLGAFDRVICAYYEWKRLV
jgi:hypothetical protein